MDVRRRLAEGEARPQGGRAEAEAPRAIADATRPLLASLIALDVSPARLDLGSVLVGERRRATFRVTSMQAGTLVIAPEPNSYLRITTATADTGIIGLEPGGASPAPTSAPPSMGAPARVALEAGQSATIVVEFKPTAQEGFTGQPTRYAGALRLTLTPPQARLLDRPAAEALTEVGPRDVSLPTQEVRATATVAGELYGIGVSLDEPTVFAHPGMTFQVFFDVYNNGVEGDATVSINTSRLPPGVTPAGPTTLQVHLGPGEERQYQSFALNGPRQAPDEPQSSMSLLVNQTSRQGSQSTIVPVDVYLNDIARKYSCYDLVEVRDATIEYKCTAFEVSFGYWQVIMNVEVLNGGNCNSFDDSTTVTIHPSPIYTRGGHFYRGNYGGLTYFDQGVSGALANDFLDYAGPISMNHTVTCHYNNPF